MAQLRMIAKEFRKMVDPVDAEGKHVKYVCYVQANSIPHEMDAWMSTNPREQKMTTDVAETIISSLSENSFFHELNRGIVMSVKSADWDNKTNDLTLFLEDYEAHGNIDGGHTLRAIMDAKSKNSLANDRYVFFEIFAGLESPVELAAARNTSVQVDLKSIAELEKSFDVLKDIFDKTPFADRIQYKMNEHYNDAKPDGKKIPLVDVRELIAITIMFSQEIYPYKTAQGTLAESQPVQCYSGKEASLRKYLYLGGGSDEKRQKQKRETMINNMRPIIKDIFDLWEEIEVSFPKTSNSSGKRYGSRKYSKFVSESTIVGKSFVKQTDLYYLVPKGLLYPLVGSFRALVQINDDGTYYWKKPPVEIWKAIGQKLASIILDEKADNPEIIAKNSNLWSNLFKEVYIFSYIS